MEPICITAFAVPSFVQVPRDGGFGSAPRGSVSRFALSLHSEWRCASSAHGTTRFITGRRSGAAAACTPPVGLPPTGASGCTTIVFCKSLEAVRREAENAAWSPLKGTVSIPVAEPVSGRAVSSHHERGYSPRPWRELHPLPCRGRFLERRQAPEARRPRMARMHRMIDDSGKWKPRNGGDSTFDQIPPPVVAAQSVRWQQPSRAFLLDTLRIRLTPSATRQAFSPAIRGRSARG